MKISHRLYLTVTPAIIGVFLTAGLAYWGQYERTAPVIVVVLGAVAVVASLMVYARLARSAKCSLRCDMASFQRAAMVSRGVRSSGFLRAMARAR